MDRQQFYQMMNGEGTLDYEVYLNTGKLLHCQKDFDALCNGDELQFQIVHQVEELWMKLIAYTLLDIDDFIRETNTNRVITLFRRVQLLQRQLIEQLSVLETMSPKDYQAIRQQLGNGSGQESPSFRTLQQMPVPLWQSFVESYLEPENLTIENIYDSQYTHGDAYMVAECLAEFDELFQKFRYHHMQLIYRSIGLGSKSLKGRSVELLQKGVRTQFYPELWAVRSTMTDNWGGEYGAQRDSISAK